MKISEYPANIRRIIKLGTVCTMLAVFFMIPLFVPVFIGGVSGKYWVMACVICWFVGILLSVYGNIKRVYYQAKER